MNILFTPSYWALSLIAYLIDNVNISLQFKKASYLRLLGLRFSWRSRRRIDQGRADCFDPLDLDHSLIVQLGGFHNVLRYHFYFLYHYHFLTTSGRNIKVIQTLTWSWLLMFQYCVWLNSPFHMHAISYFIKLRWKRHLIKYEHYH